MRKILDIKKLTDKTVFIILFIFILISVIPLSYSYSTSVPEINATLMNQEPDPVEPGEIVKLKFKIENKNAQTEQNVLVDLVYDYPFALYRASSIKNLGKLRADNSDDDAIIVEYELKVDESAIESVETVDLRIFMNGFWQIIKDLPVKVKTRDAILFVSSVESDPSTVSPGEDFRLSITLENSADSLMRNINLKLNLSSDTPFAPSKSTSRKQIYQLDSKSARVVDFDMIALPDAEGGIYKVPLSISFTDETGNITSSEEIISVRVSSDPDLLVTIDGYSINEEQKSGDKSSDLSVRVTNRALTDIKLVSAKAFEVEGIEILSEPEVYVGNIDSDDYEVADFKIKVSSYDKIIDIPIELTYRDATNVQHKETYIINLRTNKKGLAATILLSLLNFIVTISIIALLVLGVYWFYKRRKKK